MIHLIALLMNLSKTDLTTRGCMPEHSQEWVKEYQGRLNCIAIWSLKGSLSCQTSQSLKTSGT